MRERADALGGTLEAGATERRRLACATCRSQPSRPSGPRDDPGGPRQMSDPIRVLVADDQAVVREGLMTLLQATPGIEPVADAADGADAVRLAARHRPDVVLMDLRMPNVDGVQATREIRAAQPETEIVVLTTHADEASILDALRAGARGYLTKDAGIQEIARAVHAAAAHQSLLDPVVQAKLLEAVGAAVPAPAAAPRPLPDELTPREAEVLSLIARGLSNREIAAHLVVSEATVKTHVNHRVREDRRA